MEFYDATRIARLTAILTRLQSGRLVTAKQLADNFGVSVRTIYRDVKTLELAGVPVYTREGKGYSLMEGYKLPPVMFTEHEANAFITAEHLIRKTSDTSLIAEYGTAVAKIKAVLNAGTKEKAALLSQRIAVSPAFTEDSPSDILTRIQAALTSFKVLKIIYQSDKGEDRTTREIEPFAFYYSQEEKWLLVAFCRLRSDFRMFRLDRIKSLTVTDVVFTPHDITLASYLEKKQKNYTPDKQLS
ncbi:helix-turn-helix transcriptional regulator [Sediminibacterium ginsengisoli]|uniref:HTH domain-containing protein n=1 Tax=Sediminibacterium ginsengisoli TaxID=413434 RepID=A0A1T4KUT9_9BACT|nr:YafY family protein [Sediminibacterium ginsengisoli]SJZ46199.1 HTH domain-containing protein [Sediminibacterium ginsengisoli]